MRFEFATATRIAFGRGSITTLAPEAAKLGNSALVVTGSNRTRAQPALEQLEREGLSVTCFGVAGEPAISDVQSGVATAKQQGCEVVIAIGGGSAIDAGKAIAAMLGNPGELLDYLEVIGRGKALPNRSLPFIAIPTTAGTGAEVTRNAVLASPEHKVKVSLRSAGMLPTLALVDPDLTRDLPPALTASTGMDALTQLLEAFVSAKATPITDGICREGLVRCARALPHAYANGSDMAAREDMCVASLFGGLALANAGLGAVHGFAGPLGGMFPAPHGAVCAALLPHVMEVNIAALQSRDPASQALKKYEKLGKVLTGEPTAGAWESVAWVKTLVAKLQIPSLATYGVGTRDVEALAAQAKRASSMKSNPLVLNDLELGAILRQALAA